MYLFWIFEAVGLKSSHILSTSRSFCVLKYECPGDRSKEKGPLPFITVPFIRFCQQAILSGYPRTWANGSWSSETVTEFEWDSRCRTVIFDHFFIWKKRIAKRYLYDPKRWSGVFCWKFVFVCVCFTASKWLKFQKHICGSRVSMVVCDVTRPSPQISCLFWLQSQGA